jgi:2-phospho-L-lactate guanylyltransferase
MRQGLWAVVPAKSLARGKSRLSSTLGDDARAGFARSLIEHVLGVLSRCELAGILVATDGDDVADLARARGVQVLKDAGGGSLAEVVDRALVDVAARAAPAAIVLMADLPRLEPADVAQLAAALEDHDVVLVRDHLGHHTNALALAPPTAMPTRFGRPDSFEAHLTAARATRLRVAILDNERLAFDVDVPADHERITAQRQADGNGSARRG